MAKFKLHLTKTFEVDTSTWHQDGIDFLRKFLPLTQSVAPTPDQLHDAIRKALSYDMESTGVDLGDIDEDDFTIEVEDASLIVFGDEDDGGET